MDRPYFHAASMRQVLDQAVADELTAPQRLALLCLCLHAEKDGSVALTTSRLVQLTGSGERTVWRALKELTRMGYIDLPKRKGQWRRNLIALDAEARGIHRLLHATFGGEFKGSVDPHTGEVLDGPQEPVEKA